MAASFEDSRHVPAPVGEVTDAVEGALRDIGAHTVQFWNDRTEVSARIGLNIWSFGEMISIRIIAGGNVYMRSECLGVQIVDWGKNARNCRDFFNRLYAHLGQSQTLLRASVAPGASADILLRPATGAADSTPRELLRPSKKQD